MANEWKDPILKSGLPLENYAAGILSKIGFEVYGEYTYMRRMQDGKYQQFSVDLEASKMLVNPKFNHWGRLSLLIECKYNHPDCKWIFMPCPKGTFIWSKLIHYEETLCTRRIKNAQSLAEFSEYFDYCVKGILLHSGGTDTNAITHAISQVKYAIPPFLKSLNDVQIERWNDEDLWIEFVCPVILTSSPIYILKRGIPLENIKKSSELTDIAIPVDALIVHQEAQPEIKDYVRKIFTEYLERESEADSRLAQVNKIIKRDGKFREVSMWELFYISKISATENILVITLEAFGQEMKRLKKITHGLGKSLVCFAKLRKDVQTQKKWLEPL